MRLDTTALVLVALAAPALAAQTWDVGFSNNTFDPQIINIAPGDTVRWPNTDGADHAIVQTTAGNQTCTSQPGGFNSGTKTNGQAYERTFSTNGTINYKDGVGANCLKGAVGTINIGAAANGTQPGVNTSRSFYPTATAPAARTATAAPIATSAPSTPSSAAHGASAQSSIFMVVAGFIGAFVAL
ncbi:hypothetical protein BGZ99_003163 [Dissophora globulifera]|uniref:Phytocyanin domain-containing protein n=1 Tax=Dissophora globulifera TaxID=979702 RepID=A0A9P6UWG4_9FUNG|nr:hypothetical protein BGZ99_003163 [Dissophora globulifera]